MTRGHSRACQQAVGSQRPAGGPRRLGPAAGVAGRESPPHGQRSGLGAEQGSACGAVLGGEARGLGPGELAQLTGQRQGVGQWAVEERGQEQAAVGTVGTPGQLPSFGQLGQVLLHLWR